MSAGWSCDEDLVRRLPLPLAQLYRRAHNAKNALERHLTAFYLWEASLKLLASGAVAAYAERGEPDARLAERLENLARPALGHWWEFVRLLVPVLAERNDPGFQTIRELVLGRTRDDLPRAAGLEALLRDRLEGKGGARTTVRLSELFDQLVRYRNQELGHGAAGRRSGDYYERMGRALLGGTADLLYRLDVLAGRQLIYLGEVRRQTSGAWLVDRFDLTGETARRLESLEFPETAADQLPHPDRIYLWPLSSEGEQAGPSDRISLHPLVIYDPDTIEVLFLNSRRGRQRTEYLSYTTGRVVDRPDAGGEKRALLARVLGMSVQEGQVAQWAARSQVEEQAAGPADAEDQDQTPRRLGEFELLSTLGQGGMGVVYRAWQPSLGRQVALKCLLRSGDPRAEARFAREIRALGRVEQPHLVKIFTSGSEGDQWFYAMELVEGAPLSAVCEKLQSQSPSVTAVDLKTWQEALSTVCEEARQAEKPLSDVPAPPPPRGKEPAGEATRLPA
ncbi:MAG: protein kinase, partial [Planctomycetes bacterium]|nr:protein kinase [Planctomycetota bacterium]